MSRIKLSLLLGLAAAAGLGAGYLLFHGAGAGAADRGGLTAGAGPDPAPQEMTSPDMEPPGRAPLGPGPSSGPLGQESSPAAREALLGSLRERNQALVNENRELRSRLEEEQRERAFREGTPVPWPAGTPERFRQEALSAAVNAALQEAGHKGEVTDLDCKEFPCVLAGHLEGSLGSEAFKGLLSRKALAPYAEDHAQTSVSASTLRDSLGRPVSRTQFAIAFGPAPPPGTEPEVQRTIVRMRLLMDSTRER